jgi:hypothetical protein
MVVAQPINDRDFQNTAKLLASVFGAGARGYELWFEHWWALNPAWHSDIPRGWVVRSDQDEPIAFTSNIPFRQVFDGRLGLCCATGCTVVHAAFRRQGLGAAVGSQFVNQPNVDLLVGVESTDAALKLWLSLGLTKLEREWQKINFRVLGDVAALTKSLSARAGLPKPIGPMMARAASWMLTPFETSAKNFHGLSVEVATIFQPKDDDAIVNLKASDATIFQWRDVKTLNWLYFGTSYVSQTRVVLVARSGGALVGYLAMKSWGSGAYYLLECRTRDADPEIAQALVANARTYAKSQNAPYVIVRPYTPMVQRALPPSISFRMNEPSLTYCYKFCKLVDIDCWEATPGDGDLSVN